LLSSVLTDLLGAVAGNMHQVTQESVHLITALIEETKEEVRAHAESLVRLLACRLIGPASFSSWGREPRDGHRPVWCSSVLKISPILRVNHDLQIGTRMGLPATEKVGSICSAPYHALLVAEGMSWC
jgi:hypothetical protein